MRGVAKTMNYRRNTRDGHFDRAARTALAISSSLSSLVGFVRALDGYLSPKGYRRSQHLVDAEQAAGSPDCLRYPFFGRRNERTSAMIYDWQTSLRASDYKAARIVPPATVEETGWDILLALHSDRHCGLSLRKLASVVSVSDAVTNRWLAALEERELITGAQHPSEGELLAVLTDKGRQLLDRYFSATDDLQVDAHP